MHLINSCLKQWYGQVFQLHGWYFHSNDSVRKHEATQYNTAELIQPRQNMAASMHRDTAHGQVVNTTGTDLQTNHLKAREIKTQLLVEDRWRRPKSTYHQKGHHFIQTFCSACKLDVEVVWISDVTNEHLLHCSWLQGHGLKISLCSHLEEW